MNNYFVYLLKQLQALQPLKFANMFLNAQKYDLYPTDLNTNKGADATIQLSDIQV
ncbi:MAG: hypothetical protein ABI045_03890 [Flavobacteriales bacterium]